jgi:hypothetical protein
MPLDLLTAVADGRSAREFVGAIEQSEVQRSCVLQARAYGEGGSEVALISDFRVTAVYWVDHGWWRASVQPFGGLTLLYSDRTVRGTRELTLLINSGGSAGWVGFVVLQARGGDLDLIGSARENDSVGILAQDDDHILLVGRGPIARPLAWTAHCCLPGGYEWLYQRRAGRFELVAQRQAYDTYYVLSVFFGGLKAGRTDPLLDVATADAIAALKPLFADPMEVETPRLPDARTVSVDNAELRSWSVVPSSLRIESATDPMTLTFGVGRASTQSVTFDRKVQLTLSHRTRGWFVSTASVLGN